jgi:hypothetical protein
MFKRKRALEAGILKEIIEIQELTTNEILKLRQEIYRLKKANLKYKEGQLKNIKNEIDAETKNINEKTIEIANIENALKLREERANSSDEAIGKREAELKQKFQRNNDDEKLLEKKERELKLKEEELGNREKEISKKASRLEDENKKLDEDMSQKKEKEKALLLLNEKLEQMEKKIQQCYYGRDNEGFKYLAKSKNFDQYAYSQICEEISSYELSSAVKGDPIQILSKCPKKYIYFCTSEGDIFLSRTVFCEGYYAFKSPHFSHVYIIPAFHKEEYIKNIDRIFYVISFQNSYIRAIDGGELPECIHIVNDESRIKFLNTEQMFEALHINMQIFKNLLYSLFISVEQAKPVYIRLNCDAVKISDYAVELLRFLMYCLPYEVRRNLGFVTYLKKPQHVKNANIMFVEELDNECIRNAIIFDIKSEVYPVAVYDDRGTDKYMEYVCGNINNMPCLNAFYEMAEKYFESENLIRSIKISDYGKILEN